MLVLVLVLVNMFISLYKACLCLFLHARNDAYLNVNQKAVGEAARTYLIVATTMLSYTWGLSLLFCSGVEREARGREDEAEEDPWDVETTCGV